MPREPGRRSAGKPFNPIPWAIAIVIVLVFGAATYRISFTCEPTTIELFKWMKTTLGGCPAPAPPPVPPPTPTACELALRRSPVPMCGWWQVTTSSKLTGGRKSNQFTFDEPLFPIFRFQIGPYLREEQLMQFYKGTVYLRDGTVLPASFTHSRWPSGKQTDLDYERFDILLQPGMFKNEPFQFSVGGYFDRDKKQFVLRDLGLVIHNQPGKRNESVVFGIAPEAATVSMPE